ncbi:MAG: hypothetical protein EOP10_01540 [Proteobacteria bacterium]|nr:MAG: hypothetical protein EOP10_01540 [Pseudomonadota bacterium]
MNLIDSKSGLFLILIMGMLGFLIVKKSGNRLEIQKPSTQSPVKTMVAKQAVIAAPVKELDTSAAQTARRNFNIVLLNGITKVPSVVTGNKIRVLVQPTPEAQWCKSGDFDLIKSLAPNTSDKFITLSLESIGDKGVKRSQTYSLSDLNANRTMTFDIPVSDGAYGLYLCMDQSKKGGCANKQAIPNEIWSASPSKVKALAANKIFYFQLLQVKDKTVHIIPSQDWGKNNLRSLKSRLGDWMGDDVSALERMDELVSKIRPIPARLANSRIEIPLPYNDLRCAGR